MRNYILILVAGLMTAAPWACSSDPIDGTTGSGGSGTTGSQTTGTMTATSGSMSSVAVSSSSGMMGDCTGKLSGACGTCAEGSCCTELAACDQTCVDCIAGNGPMGCNMGMAESAVLQCLSDNCQSDCFAPATPPACDAPAVSPTMGSCVTLGPGVVCNPVTNEGCTGAGQACDIDGNTNTYVCYDPPNDVAVCGTCSGSNGPFCMPGHTCQGTQCAKYCCNDCDCGSGHCDLAALTGFGLAVGVCVEGAGMPMNCGTGGAGGTGAGTGGAGGTGAGTGGTGTGGTGTGGGATTGAGGTGGTGG